MCYHRWSIIRWVGWTTLDIIFLYLLISCKVFVIDSNDIFNYVWLVKILYSVFNSKKFVFIHRSIKREWQFSKQINLMQLLFSIISVCFIGRCLNKDWWIDTQVQIAPKLPSHDSHFSTQLGSSQISQFFLQLQNIQSLLFFV